MLIVVGSPSSSNSNRLRELAERLGADAYMVDTADDLRAEWFEGKRRVGLTAGASAPEVLVEAVVARLRALGAVSVRSVSGTPERVHFPLPMGLGDKAMREVAELSGSPGPRRSQRGSRRWKVIGARRRRRLRPGRLRALSQPSQAQPSPAACAACAVASPVAAGSGSFSSARRSTRRAVAGGKDPRRTQRAGDDEQRDDEGLGHRQPPRASVTR